MADKRKKRRAAKGKQRIVKRYQKDREDMQLIGALPTSPDGAVRSERVDPATQGSQPLPGPVGQAVRNGWATPEPMKVAVVDEMYGLVVSDETEPHVKVAAARVLQQGDQAQREWDDPERAGKTKGGVKVGVEVTNNNQVNLLDLAREAMARDPLEEAKRQISDGTGGRGLETNDEPT